MKKTFINSLPKSGTNLLAKCLLLFGYQEKGHISTGTILDRTVTARLKRAVWQTRSTGYSIGINSPIEVRKLPIDLKLKQLRENQFLSGHVGYNALLLGSILDKGIVPVQMLRDPRAVLASFVPYIVKDKNHFLHELFLPMSPVARYEAALFGASLGGLTLQPMKSYCQALVPWTSHPGVHCIRYEDIVGEQGGGSTMKQTETLEQLADILDLPKTLIGEVASKLYGPGRHTFRKGNIGSWKEEIPEEILQKIPDELGEILTQWGYHAT